MHRHRQALRLQNNSFPPIRRLIKHTKYIILHQHLPYYQNTHLKPQKDLRPHAQLPQNTPTTLQPHTHSDTPGQVTSIDTHKLVELEHQIKTIKSEYDTLKNELILKNEIHKSTGDEINTLVQIVNDIQFKMHELEDVTYFKLNDILPENMILQGAVPDINELLKNTDSTS